QNTVTGGNDAGEQGGRRAGENSKVKTQNSKLTYGFKVASYDKTRELVIDPLLASTFLGGSSGDIGRALTRDADGNIYVAGETDSSDFPVTSGAYSSTGAKTDMFVSKLSADLMTLLESTVFGGSDEDVATSVAVSPFSDDIYVTGFTRSTDFPVKGAYDASFNGGPTDIVIAKFNGDLARLLASTYLGGNGEGCNDCLFDDYAGSIKIAPDYSVVVAGFTFSKSFPTSKDAFDQSHGDYADGIVSVLSGDLSSLLASTYLGGGGGDFIGGYFANDFGDALAIGSKGDIYVGGSTSSLDFPVTAGAYDSEKMLQGDTDAFVTKFNRKLTGVIASTFLGGVKHDDVFKFDVVCSLSLGSGGEVYVAGFTQSDDFPTTEGAYDRTYNGASGYEDDDIFVSKLDMDLSYLTASTFLGGSYTDRCAAIVIDKQKNVVVAGRTRSDVAEVSNDFPTTPGAFDWKFDQSTGSDGILSKLDGDLSRLMASTFLGGAQGKEDRPHALAVDTQGNVYVAGETYSSDFPTTLGSYDECFGGFYDSERKWFANRDLG
ncbi:MAG: SBBP repeat-containing protein, partial [Planctomycetes bacterium]|nr:SBBP repeat-containing protein [Planctomycetota bacterium]